MLLLSLALGVQAQDYQFARALSLGDAPKSVYVNNEKLYTLFTSNKKLVISSLEGEVLTTQELPFLAIDMAVDAAGNYVVASKDGKKVYLLTPAGEEIKQVSFTEEPNSVTIRQDGSIYVSLLTSVQVLDSELNLRESITTLSADKFREVRDVIFDRKDQMYIVDKNTGVLKISSYANGKAQVAFMIKKDTPNNYNNIASLAVASGGDLFLTSEVEKSGCLPGVYRFDENGTRVGEVGPLGMSDLDEAFGQPYGIVMDASENLYVADVKNNKVKVWEAVDMSAPVLSHITVAATQRGKVALSFTAGEIGHVHYIVQDASLPAPDVATLKAAPQLVIESAQTMQTVQLEVETETPQQVYLLTVDAAMNYSEVYVTDTVSVETNLLLSHFYVKEKASEEISISYLSNDQAKAYWVLVAEDAAPLTAAQIIAGQGGVAAGSIELQAQQAQTLVLDALSARGRVETVLVAGEDQSEQKSLTVAPFNDVDKVYARYQDLLLGESLDYNDPTVMARYTALKQTITTAYQQLSKYQWEEGLPAYDLVTSAEARTVASNVLLPLAMSYNLQGPADAPNADYQNPVLAKQILDLYDYLAKRGVVSGSNIHFTSGGSFLGMCGYFYASILMRETLLAADAWEPVAGMMLWTSREVNPENDQWGAHVEHNGSRSDGVRTLYQYRLMALIAQTDSMETRESEMAYLTAALNQNMRIAPAWDGFIKPDFTGYHHHGPWGNAYNTDALHTAAQMGLMLRDTEYALNEQSIDNLANSLLTFRAYCAKYDISRGMSGRFPNQLDGLVDNIPAFAYMYQLLDAEAQQEMGAAFNSLYDPNYSGVIESCIQDVKSNIFFHGGMGALQLMNETKALTANLHDDAMTQFNAVYPYSGMQVHRRDDWAAIVKSYTKYVWDFETNEEQNWFGRNQSAGALSIYATPDAEGVVTSAASGVGYNGWDWSHVPGTTTFDMPLDSILREVQLYTMAKFSPSALAGGVSLKEGHGLYAMRYNDIRQAYHYTGNKWGTKWRGVTLSALKSWFFFDDYIVAVASDIDNTHEHFDAHTTIFQNQLMDVQTPIYVNGAAQTGLGYAYDQTTDAPVVLTDAVGNAYYFENGAGLHIHRESQTSRQDRNYNTVTTGNYATAWLDHGRTTGGAYHYAIHVRGAEQAKNGMQNALLDYAIEQQDEMAHIVNCEAKGLKGYAIFKETTFANDELLTGVDKPCMVMTRAIDEEQIQLSLSNPELGFYPEDKFPYQVWSIDKNVIFADSEEQPVALTIKGMWQLAETHPSVAVSGYDAAKDETALLFAAKDAVSCEVTLKKMTVGLDAAGAVSNMQMGPNPCKDTVRVKFADADSRMVELLSLSGHVMMQQQGNASEIVLSVAHLAAGAYFVRIDGEIKGKLLKK